MYVERSAASGFVGALSFYVGLVVLASVLFSPSWIRYRFLPRPGQGPSDDAMEKAYLQVLAFTLPESLRF